ncbi:hypothetical protein D3C75_1020390 [compost metagenome]
MEKRLEEIRQFRQIGFVRRQAVLTPSYEPRYHGSTNCISNPTENIALWNIDKERELKEREVLLNLTLTSLSTMHREVIERSYLDNEGEFDYINCGIMGVSERTYSRIKREAIYIIAASLGLEKYKLIT